MRVVVVGAGAVGSFLGATLALAGVEVTLVGRPDGPDGDEIELVDRGRPPRRAPVRRAAVAAIGIAAGDGPDAAILAVKQPDVAAAAGALAAWPSLPVVTVQNGIGAEQAVAAARPGGAIVAASLTTSVELVSPRRVVRLNRGGIGLAAVDPGDGRAVRTAAELRAAFERGGLRGRVLADATAMKWSKLLANLVGNASSAILDLDPAAIYADPRLFEIERRQLGEALAVMRALGVRPVPLPGADARLLALSVRLPAGIARPILARVVAAARGGKSPSLRAHVARAGDAAAPSSEVAWLNGAVANEGARHSVRTPVNETLSRLVDEVSVDPGRRAFFRRRPDRLLEALAR